MLGALYYPKGTKKDPIPFDSLYIPWIYKEIYFDGIYADVLNQKKDMVIIDVGANSGLVTQHMRDYAKKLYAIEPSPEHFEALEKNKEFNKWDNVEVFNVAMADQDGEMKLNINTINRTCHSVATDSGHGYTKSKTVKTVRFDTFMEENNIDEVDFVKFDVEGAEDMILRGSGFYNVHDKIKAIEVEFHYPTWNLLVEHMIKLGFTARRYDCSAVVVLFTR